MTNRRTATEVEAEKDEIRQAVLNLLHRLVAELGRTPRTVPYHRPPSIFDEGQPLHEWWRKVA
jgi:hypothetical protein